MQIVFHDAVDGQTHRGYASRGRTIVVRSSCGLTRYGEVAECPDETSVTCRACQHSNQFTMRLALGGR